MENIVPVWCHCLAGVDVIDLEGSIAVAQAALDVKQAESVAIFSTPRSTEKVHDWPKSWVHDILAGVVDGLNKSSVGIVGDTLNHLDHLTVVVIETGSLNVAVGYDKGRLFWGAGHVAEVLAEVVVARRTGGSEEDTDLLKVES